jgi:hypothetical protein
VDPREHQPAVPIKGAQASSATLVKETESLLVKDVPGNPWFYQRFPAGAEQGLGTILQGNCAGHHRHRGPADRTREIIEASILDRVGGATRFWRITLPMVMPSVTVFQVRVFKRREVEA